MSDESQLTNLATETKYSIVKNRIPRAKTPVEDSISIKEKGAKEEEEDEDFSNSSKLVTFNETSTFVPTVGTEERNANETPVELEEAVPLPSSARAVSTPASESSPRPSEITKQSEKMSPIEGSFSGDEEVDEENLSITSATTVEDNDGDKEDDKDNEDDKDENDEKSNKGDESDKENGDE